MRLNWGWNNGECFRDEIGEPGEPRKNTRKIYCPPGDTETRTHAPVGTDEWTNHWYASSAYRPITYRLVISYIIIRYFHLSVDIVLLIRTIGKIRLSIVFLFTQR